MDVDDNIISFPDESGYLDLSNRSWVRLDSSLWTMGRSLIELNLSYNRIIEIPSQIGNLEMLRILRFSFNKIVELPSEIGKLKRLRELHINSNNLQRIPYEISQLLVLEELYLSENHIEELPLSIIELHSIRIIKLQNNKLRSIPIELPLLSTLENIDLSNNTTLEMIPLEWRGNTKSIKMLCELHKNYQDKINELIQTSQDSTAHLEQLEIDQLRLEEQVAALTYEVSELSRNVLKNTRLRISAAAKIHASRGSIKEDKKNIDDFPCIDDPNLYDVYDPDDNVDRNSIGQQLKENCCILS